MRLHSQSVGNSSLNLREILLLGLFAAILIIAQVALAFLPNIELVSLLIIIYTLVLGRKVFFPVYVFILAEGLIFGFGMWWFSWLYTWGALASAVLIFRRNGSPVFWAVFSGVFGLMYGALSSIPYLVAGGIGAAVSYWINGIPFDLLHCAGNIAAALLLFRPGIKILRKLYFQEKFI